MEPNISSSQSKAFLVILVGSFFLFLLLPGDVNGQLGAQFQYRLPLSLAESADLADPLIQSGWSAGVVYSFRQQGIRIEWLPGIHFIQTKADLVSGGTETGTGAQATFDFRAYPMDLYGDCMCPTFSRKGQVLQKGFFLEAGVGGYYLDQSIVQESDAGGSFLARVGAGVDIGLSRRLTITPGVRIQYEDRLHYWGGNATQIQSRPLWIYPYIQMMTYFDN